MTPGGNRQEILDSSPGGVTQGEGHAQASREGRRMKRPPYPRYKPSGVEWLGEVPEPWDTLECKFGYSIQLGKMLQNGPQTPNDEQVPYLKALYEITYFWFFSEIFSWRQIFSIAA
jgi:hypothetical protein